MVRFIFQFKNPLVDILSSNDFIFIYTYVLFQLRYFEYNSCDKIATTKKNCGKIFILFFTDNTFPKVKGIRLMLFIP